MGQYAVQAARVVQDAGDCGEPGGVGPEAAAVAVAVDLDLGGKGDVSLPRGRGDERRLLGAVQQDAQGDTAA